MKRWHGGLVILLATAALAGAGSDAPAASTSRTPEQTSSRSETPPPELTHLTPGGAVDLQLEIPVTIVYVGLEPGAPPRGIDPAAVEARQPAFGQPLVLQRAFAGYLRPLGLTYTYSYESVFADQDFEDDFFAAAASTARPPGPATEWQARYSQQPAAALDITENTVMDAVAVENWLATNAGPMLGVDTSLPTVFLVNWYGRPDFRHHTYAPFHVLPGNKSSFGGSEQGHFSAWGGSTADDPQYPLDATSRVWFYDVSAGPDYWTENYELEEVDHYTGWYLPPDNRLPPIWEYGTRHWYRPFTDLSADLAEVIRYVAVGKHFGPSPRFDPALSPPALQHSLEVDVNVVTDLRNQQFEDPLATQPNPARVAAALGAFDPSRSWTVDVETGFSLQTYEEPLTCLSASDTFHFYEPGPCSNPDSPSAYYDLAFEFDATSRRLLENRRGQVPVVLFDVPDHRWAQFGITDTAINFPGQTYDEPSTGIQTWPMVFDTPILQRSFQTPDHAALLAAASYLGLGRSLVFDAEDYAAWNDMDQTFFLRLAMGTPSVTSTLPITLGLSQFERDAMDRWQTAVRLQWANHLLARVYASPNADRAREHLLSADAHAGDAAERLAEWDLRAASASARAAYDAVVDAMRVLRLPVEEWSARDDQGPIGLAAWAQDPVVNPRAAKEDPAKPLAVQGEGAPAPPKADLPRPPSASWPPSIKPGAS